jgi:hypothetical protein
MKIAMARREMLKGWNKPERKLFETAQNANYGRWLNYLVTQVDYIIQNKKGNK